jgi:hypothetical protein
MASNRIAVREAQKKKFEAQIACRKEKLAKLGLTEAQQKNDKVLQHLQAEVKRSARAVASIEKLKKVVDGARQKKIDNAAKAAAEGPKKKKSAAAPVKEEKKDKKAKKAEKAAGA